METKRDPVSNLLRRLLCSRTNLNPIGVRTLLQHMVIISSICSVTFLSIRFGSDSFAGGSDSFAGGSDSFAGDSSFFII